MGSSNGCRTLGTGILSILGVSTRPSIFGGAEADIGGLDNPLSASSAIFLNPKESAFLA